MQNLEKSTKYSYENAGTKRFAAAIAARKEWVKGEWQKPDLTAGRAKPHKIAGLFGMLRKPPNRPRFYA